MTSTWADLTAKNPGDQFLDTLYDSIIADLDYLRNPPDGFYALSTGDPNISTSSATMVDLTGFSVTITVQANAVGSGPLVMVVFTGRCSSANGRFDIMQDGVSITGDSSGMGGVPATGNITMIRFIAATAGSHTYKIQWRSTSGSINFEAVGLGQLYVVQKR